MSVRYLIKKMFAHSQVVLLIFTVFLLAFTSIADAKIEVIDCHLSSPQNGQPVNLSLDCAQKLAHYLSAYHSHQNSNNGILLKTRIATVNRITTSTPSHNGSMKDAKHTLQARQDTYLQYVVSTDQPTNGSSKRSYRRNSLAVDLFAPSIFATSADTARLALVTCRSDFTDIAHNSATSHGINRDCSQQLNSIIHTAPWQQHQQGNLQVNGVILASHAFSTNGHHFITYTLQYYPNTYAFIFQFLPRVIT